MKQWSLLFALVVAVLFLSWPYYRLWELDQAVAHNDRLQLAELVDLDAVRAAFKRRLNKELADSSNTLANVSNAFIAWLQDGIRLLGNDAVDRLVTLEWVQQQLLMQPNTTRPRRLLNRVSFAFFDRPNRFLVRLNDLDQDPVHVRWSLDTAGWRITAVYP